MYENQKTDAATFSSDDLDKTPPQLNEKGHLTPEEVIKRTTCSETVETTIVGNKSKCAEPTEIKVSDRWAFHGNVLFTIYYLTQILQVCISYAERILP